jgi:hypothetical protein
MSGGHEAMLELAATQSGARRVAATTHEFSIHVDAQCKQVVASLTTRVDR